MAFTIPNTVDAAFASQAEPDSRDFDILAAAAATTGVATGCAVTSTGAANGSLTVAAGTARVGGRKVTVAGGTVAITANASGNPRFDLVTVDTSGTLAAVAGTTSVFPVFPTIPAGRAVLASMYVATGHTTGTTINNNTLTDKRVLLSDAELENVKWYGATGNARSFVVTGGTAGSGTVTSQLAVPGTVATSTVTTGGTLAAATYGYRVSAFNQYGETTASASVTRVTTGTTSTVTITWAAVTGALGYRIYGRTSGSELFMETVMAPVTSYTDTGGTAPSGALPAANTTGPFAATMVGQAVYISGAGTAGAQYVGSISAYSSSSSITVSPNLATNAPAGATAAAGTDDSTAVNAAAAALANGSTLYFPAGSYIIGAGLLIDSRYNITITGDYATVIGTTETSPVLYVRNSAQFAVEKLRVQHATTTARTSGGYGIYIKWCQDVIVDGNYVYQVCAAGILMNTVHRCTVVANTVQNNLADGIHTTGASRDVDVVGNRLINTGDDSIAFVSYRADGNQVQRFTCTTNSVYQCNARGIAAIGAAYGSIVGNTVNTTTAAGIMVAQETSYNSYGAQDITVEGNTVINAVTLNSTTDHGAIFVNAADAAFPVSGISIIGNHVRTPRRHFIRTAGATGALKDVSIVGNQCIGPQSENVDGIVLSAGTALARVSDNRVAYSQVEGIVSNATTAVIDNNEIYFPNQSSGASNAGINRAAGTALIYDNAVLPDGGKTALLRNVTPMPTAAAVSGASGAGTSPPAPVVVANSTDQTGAVTFGTGTTAVGTGAYVTVTFANPFPVAPKVAVYPTNQATSVKSPYVLTVGVSSFQIGLGVAGALSQANTVYGVGWTVDI